MRDLDPAIERAILRCLEHDPARRPASALAVAAALPGGDPLAAALAAGETPSPEMVAAAGETSALAPRTAIARLGGDAAVSRGLRSLDGVGAGHQPAAAREVSRCARGSRARCGTRARVQRRAGGHGERIPIGRRLPPVRRARRAKARQSATGCARDGRPVLLFWYRSSPRQMVPTGSNDNVSTTDPPFDGHQHADDRARQPRGGSSSFMPCRLSSKSPPGRLLLRRPRRTGASCSSSRASAIGVSPGQPAMDAAGLRRSARRVGGADARLARTEAAGRGGRVSRTAWSRSR